MKCLKLCRVRNKVHYYCPQQVRLSLFLSKMGTNKHQLPDLLGRLNEMKQVNSQHSVWT